MDECSWAGEFDDAEDGRLQEEDASVGDTAICYDCLPWIVVSARQRRATIEHEEPLQMFVSLIDTRHVNKAPCAWHAWRSRSSRTSICTTSLCLDVNVRHTKYRQTLSMTTYNSNSELKVRSKRRQAFVLVLTSHLRLGSYLFEFALAYTEQQQWLRTWSYRETC